jgi:hypothetical protein
MKKLINWFNNNILAILTMFLLVFIPLYPKIPLFDVFQTWVYIRLEDFFVAIALFCLTVFYIKEKKISKTPFTFPIIIYWVIGLISLINALLFIFPHFTSILFPHLAVLHYLRRIEYMGVFFLAFAAFRRKPNFWMYISVISGTFLMVLLYGTAQKFLGFPAFLTMNEEFAKGVPLRLPPTARIPSTFGGHYDLAAYLVFFIPIIGSLSFAVQKWWQKILFILLTAFGLIVLLFTASRVSFIVYLIAISMMLYWQKKSIFIIPVIILSIIILNFTSGASERFYKTFRFNDVVVDLSTGKPIGTLDKIEGKNNAILEKIASPDQENLPKGSDYISVPITESSKNESDKIKVVQYYVSKSLASGSGEMATISGSFLIQKALVYDISITTRFQGEWPNAIKAFYRNVFLGSGYSSLSVAVDGDYFRMLGETGLIGAVSFLGILGFGFYIFIRSFKTIDNPKRSLLIGIFAGIIGLLLNAILIDVFEASKVAFTFWLVCGLGLAMIDGEKYYGFHKYIKFIWRVFTHPIAIAGYLVLIIWWVWYPILTGYFIGDDFTWLRWAAESTLKDLPVYFTRAGGFFYRPLPKLWYFLLFTIFWLKPLAYHIASLVLYSGIVLFLYGILNLRGVKRIFSWFGALLFSILALNHENVFWISGQSCLLSAFFLSGGLFILMREWTKPGKYTSVLKTMGIVSVFSAMLSYDGMLIAPLIVWIIGITLYGKNRNWNLMLGLIPLYIVIRYYSGAVWPSGNYGYKISTFIPNSAVNGFGYLLSIFTGPWIADKLSVWRGEFRRYIIQITAFISLFSFSGCILAYLFRKKLILFREYWIWLVLFAIALGAYLPLGGMDERYMLIPAIFLMIFLTVSVNKIWQISRNIPLKLLIILIVFVTGYFNIKYINRLSGDWQKASQVVDDSLLKIKNETFPPKNAKGFFFVNTPIRYGRAWIFPTGLTDAIWHMYRQTPFTVSNVSTMESAFTEPYAKGDREVFIFENLVLNRGIRQIIEVKNK